MTTRRLEHHGLPFVYHDVTEDQDAYDRVIAMGYQTLPVVTAGDMQWSRFRLEKLDTLARIYPDAVDIADLAPAAEEYLAADPPDMA